MKKLFILLFLSMPFACLAEAYQSTLLVQTGQMRESDLIVRTITDLESSRICLAFYIRTTGTSPVMSGERCVLPRGICQHARHIPVD